MTIKLLEIHTDTIKIRKFYSNFGAGFHAHAHDEGLAYRIIESPVLEGAYKDPGVQLLLLHSPGVTLCA